MATLRQAKTAKILSENVRKSVSAAMRDAGYSKRSAEKPQRLIQSRGWQELVIKHLPDEKLLGVHKELLQNPDWRARDAGLEKAYKLRGVYKPEKLKLVDDLDDLSIEEIDSRLAQMEPIVGRYKLYKKCKQ